MCGLTHYDFDSQTGEAEGIVRPYSIVVHQDCDLLRDHEAFNNGMASAIPSVLLIEMFPIDDLMNQVQGQDIRKQIKQNRHERYHVLAGLRAEFDLQNLGLGEMVADFRMIFSISPREIRTQLTTAAATRHANLIPPYREHFQNRFGFYMQRVALPE